eukprot:TRINITY_DN8439_c0_g2_i1.p1 TRINITY_DN8439_c0_g2~~TRINITY_DN8439_c0_g2_i1.p1  ORF type:complete len:332 (+),score=82.36 TRINITY_DN8439_c0_g2_i1:71-997(+)
MRHPRAAAAAAAPVLLCACSAAGAPQRLLAVYVGLPRAADGVERELVRWADGAGCRVETHSDDFLSMPPLEQDDFCVLAGHRGWGVHEQPGFPPPGRRDVRYFTVLREPWQRLWAVYEMHNAHLARRGQEPLRFDRFLDAKEAARALDAELSHPHSPVLDGAAHQLCCWLTPHRAANGSSRHGPCPAHEEERVRCAVEHLERMAAVGIAEHPERTAQLLAAAVGVSVPPAAVARGAPGQPPPELSPADRARAAALLRPEEELYSAGRRIFEREFRALAAAGRLPPMPTLTPAAGLRERRPPGRRGGHS